MTTAGLPMPSEGSLPRAITDFTMAIAINPKDAEAYNNRGHAYAQKGNLSQALDDFTSAIQNNAFYVKAYNNRALAFYKLENYDRAWSDVRMVKEIGGTTDTDFIESLKKSSGKDQ